MKSLMFLSAALAAIALPLPAAAVTAPADHAETAPTRFNVEVTGEGRDLVLIPGLSSSREVWEETVAAFSDRYRVHTIEVAGFGHDAGVNAEGEILPGLVSELAAYLEGLDNPLVVGHSMGGFTGLKLALDHPNVVGELLIVDSLPFFSVLINPNATVETVRPQAEQLRATMVAMADAELPAPDCAAPSMQAVSMSITKKGQCRVDRISFAADRKVVAQVMYEVMTTDLRDRLAELSVETTMLYPYADPAPSADMAAGIYGNAYGSSNMVTLVPVANSRHFIMYDQPDAFHEALEAALSD